MLIAGQGRLGLVCAVAAMGAGLPVAFMAYAPQGAAPPGVITIYTKNTLGRWGDHDAIAADILASGADIVLLQELSVTIGDYPTRLRPTHPHQHICRFSDWSGMAVISRWPLSEPYCSPHRSFAAARIEGPSGPFWAISTHLVWPYPHGQAEILNLALPFLDRIEGPAVIAGDFNMVAWGASVHRIARATGTARIGALYETLNLRGLPLTIDHVLTDGRGVTERRPRFQSDHYGLVAQIAWAPRD